MTTSSIHTISLTCLSLCFAALFLLACDDDAAEPSLAAELSDDQEPARAGGEPTGMDLSAPPVTPRTAQFAGELQLTYAGALCNDGSEPVIHVKLDPNGGTNWLVYLQGGGNCNDEISCLERWQDCTRNDDYIGWHGNMEPDDIDPTNPPNFDNDGILDFDGHDFGTGVVPSPFDGLGFNRVFIPYCSSDFWRGLGHTQTVNFPAACGDPARTEIYFGGARIVEGVIAEIMNHAQAPGAGDFIVLAGGSAGGQGVQHNLERVADQVLASGVTVVGVADAAFAVGLSQTATPSSASVDSELYWAADTSHTPGDAIDVAVNDTCWSSETGAAKDYCHDSAYMVPNHMQQYLLLTTNTYDKVVHGGLAHDMGAFWPNECSTWFNELGNDADQDALYYAYCDPSVDPSDDIKTWIRYQIGHDGAGILDATSNPSGATDLAYFIAHSELGLHDKLLKESEYFYKEASYAELGNTLGGGEFAGLGTWTSTSGNNDDPSVASTVACALGLVGVPGAPTNCVLDDVRVTSSLPTNISVIENYMN